MDLLSKRYASPCFLLDGMILTGRLDEFVDDFIRTTNEEIEFENKEKEMHMHWDFFLHRVLDQSFKEYMDEIENTKRHQNMSKGILETTVQHSNDILNNFNPEGGE
jgi:hypothetical protein